MKISVGVEAAAGETPSLTGEFAGETHRVLECTQTHAHPCTYIMEYYSAMRKKEILSFMTICMKLEDIILSEINGVRKILHGGGTKMEA